MIGNIVGSILGHSGTQVKGQVVILDKSVLGFNDLVAGGTNFLLDLLGQQVSLQLVSATAGDPNNGNRGVIGEVAYLEKPFSIIPLPNIIAGETTFGVTFRLKEGDGIPGAVIVKNRHLAEFFLKSITIENYPGKGRVHFDCNSWVYNVSKYSYDRVFFANDTYLPKDTPGPLRPYREDELRHLRGDDVNRQLDEPDRIYSYAYYNDLGNPDLGSGLARPVLGGSAEYPYPRRGKTGRPPTRTDPKSESRFPLQLNSYVPRDERFGHLKMSDFLGYSIKAVSMALLPVLRTAFDSTPNTFNGYDDVLRLYEGGLKLPNFPPAQALVDAIPLEMLKSILTPAKGQGSVLKFPVPQIIQGDKWRWNSDEEFAREMLAGLNPVIIEGLKEFPPTSQLDPALYGDQNSKITEEHIKNNLEGLTAQQAVNRCRLFILNHHDALMPYLTRINSTSTKTYASRTLLFLKDDDTLKPIAIELSLPHPDGEHHGAVSAVYTPSDSPVQAAIWQLAKAFVSVNDFGVHELISHWLRTHAIMEPFVLATNRHLSALHPINKLLVPHYRDTMNINALARQALVNADGIIELSFSFSKYAMELSSLAYKSWNFALQALPADLLHRGMAVEDPSSPNKVRLLIKDYPYAVDGLAIWSAIEAWVADYCSVYYPQDSTVLNDGELQAWWKEAVEVGHADLKGKPWWPRLDSISSLVQICSTIIWVASAMHAAINFGQYPYGGYVPNRPTISRQFMPEPGSPDYEQLKTNPDKVFFKTITGQLQSILALSVIEILSTHSSDEVYLGQRASDGWTSDQKAIDALKRFGQRLKEVERSIGQLNENKGLKNRGGGGSLNFSYTLLSPFSEEGLTGKGIPNSISI